MSVANFNKIKGHFMLGYIMSQDQCNRFHSLTAPDIVGATSACGTAYQALHAAWQFGRVFTRLSIIIFYAPHNPLCQTTADLPGIWAHWKITVLAHQVVNLRVHSPGKVAHERPYNHILAYEDLVPSNTNCRVSAEHMDCGLFMTIYYHVMYNGTINDILRCTLWN